VASGLPALLEIIRNIHRGCLVVDRAPNVRRQMRHLARDVHTFAVCIEDQRATIRAGVLWAFYLTIQLSFYRGEFTRAA
jgi:hypothetical protein